MSNPRARQLLIVSRRLVIFAAASIVITGLLFGLTLIFEQRLMVSWLCLECGIVGGFVSVQQRLGKIKNDELAMLSESWAAILVIPIYGGIFALLLYVMFLAELVQGNLFPTFYVPAFSDPPQTSDLVTFLRETYPKQGADFAKLILWSFVAGFSERFVPQIISSVASDSSRGSDKVERP